MASITGAYLGCFKLDVISDSPPPQEGGYVDTVDGLAGGEPLAHWRCGTIDQLTDRKTGARHATFTGTPSLVSGLPENSDQALDLGGVATASLTHDSGLALAAFGLSFWVTPLSAPGADQKFFLIAKEASGLNLGDFLVELDQDLILTAQFQTAAAFFPISTTAPLEVGTSYHVMVRADSSGFDLHINAQLIGSSSGHTGALSSNTNNLTFGTAPLPAAVAADVVIDEIALYDYAPTDADIATLAQAVGVPVATDDGAGVAESNTTAIDVVANDSFVGAKSSLTVTIVDDSSVTGAGHSVSVNGSNDVDFVASAVTVDEQVSFTYTIADVNGTSNTATVNVTVQNAGAAPSNAVCYSNGTPTATVGSIAALNTAIAAAIPGDEIVISNGTYNGGTVTINAQGTAANPIIIRPQNDDNSGTVVFSGVNVNWNAAASRVVFAGIRHNGGRHTFRGNNCRIDRCRFRQFVVAIAIEGALNSRISRCDASVYSPVTPTSNDRHFVRTDPTSILSGATNNVLVDYCYIHDISISSDVTAGREVFAGHDIGGATNFNKPAGTIIIDHCLFQNISYGGDSELITMKFGGYIMRFCTVVNSAERVVFRRANNCEVRSSWFESTSVPIEAYGSNHLIIGNRFVGGTVRINRGTDVYPNVNNGTYMAFKDSEVVGNSGTGTIEWGRMNQAGSNTPIQDNNHFVNTCTMNFIAGGHTGTTNTNPGISFVAAVKLLPADVGLNVGDSLCG